MTMMKEKKRKSLSASDLDDLLRVLLLKFGLRAGSEALIAISVLHKFRSRK